jgi:hypothetical protein
VAATHKNPPSTHFRWYIYFPDICRTHTSPHRASWGGAGEGFWNSFTQIFNWLRISLMGGQGWEKGNGSSTRLIPSPNPTHTHEPITPLPPIDILLHTESNSPSIPTYLIIAEQKDRIQTGTIQTLVTAWHFAANRRSIKYFLMTKKKSYVQCQRNVTSTHRINNIYYQQSMRLCSIAVHVYRSRAGNYTKWNSLYKNIYISWTTSFMSTMKLGNSVRFSIKTLNFLWKTLRWWVFFFRRKVALHRGLDVGKAFFGLSQHLGP